MVRTDEIELIKPEKKHKGIVADFNMKSRVELNPWARLLMLLKLSLG